MNKIDSKFKEFGFSSFDSNVSVFLAQFQKFKNNHKSLLLPQEYQYFLKKYGDCSFEKDTFFKSIENMPKNKDENLGLVHFYGVGHLSSALSTYSGRVPKGFLPIAGLPGGDLICMDIDKISKTHGRVYSWDHEDECDGCLENIYLIANNFEDFVDSFEIDNTSNNDDDGIEDFHFDF